MGDVGAVKRLVRSVRARLVMLSTAHSPFPIYPSFGFGSGTPVDRHYIEGFLDANSSGVRGRVLEIGDREYTTRFGKDRVTRSDVLSAEPSDDPRTIVGDLSDVPQIESDTYDCIILTQTLHYIREMPRAVAELHRILKPGGLLLVTVPGISQVSAWDMERWGDRWRLTDLGLSELLSASFDPGQVHVETFGNAAAAVAFLQGIPAEKIARRVLAPVNAEYPVVVAARVAKEAE